MSSSKAGSQVITGTATSRNLMLTLPEVTESEMITSALPLTDAEKQSAAKVLGAKDVQYKVDPSILGGLVVRVGDRVVDDSVSNRMSALQESLRR